MATADEPGAGSARTRRPLDLVGSLVAVVDAEERVVDANAAWTRVLGWDAADLQGVALPSLLLDGAVTGPDAPVRVRARRGGWRWVRWTTHVGNGDGAVLVGEDVTDLRHVQEELKELKLLHARLMDHVPAGVVYLDAKGVLLYENRYCVELFGGDPGTEPAGLFRNILELETTRDEAAFHARITRLLQGEPFEEFVFPYRSLRGHHLVLRLSGIPEFHDTPGGRRVAGAVLLVSDITATHANPAHHADEHAAREVARLRELETLRTTFINAAAHELRTPLTPLGIQLHVLEHSPELGPKSRRSVQLLRRNVDRLAALVEDILDGARLQAGRLRLSGAEVDLATVVQEAAEPFIERGRATGRRVRVETPGAAIVDGDERRLHQVLQNLLNNALTHTTEGDTVALRIEVTDREVRVLVVDTGRGIAPAHRDRLFRPFGQVGDGDAGRRGGTGLGLYISKGIVEAHGGRIWVESDGPGKGSSFIFALPLARPPSGP